MPAIGLLVPLIVVAAWVLMGLRIVNEYEQGVVLRLGRFVGMKTAGLKWIVPFVDRMIIIDMRVTAEQVPPQDVITRDNVSMKVNAVIYFRVVQADRAFLQVTDFLFATSQFAQTTLRSVLGQVDLDDVLSQRDKINRQLQEIIDRHTEPWGVKVTAVEAGGGGARAALEDHQRRGRVPGRREAQRGRRRDRALAGRAAAPLHADAGRDLHREDEHHHLPDADRPGADAHRHHEAMTPASWTPGPCWAVFPY